MKKAAKKSSRSKALPQKKQAEKVIIPPDILGDKASNVTQPESEEVVSQPAISDDVSQQIEPEVNIQPENSQAQTPPQAQNLSFYEKVTGEKKPQIQPVDDNTSFTHSDAGDIDEDMPQIERSNRKLFFLGGVVFLLTILVTFIAGVFILHPFENGEKKSTPVEEEIVPSPTPTTTVINKKDWKFEVLNGSGEAGKAKKTAESIESMGYIVEGTGNADRSDYTGVTISFAEEVDESVREIIVKDLEKEFLTVKEEDINQETDASILVIVGK